jgi:hypothetical protein
MKNVSGPQVVTTAGASQLPLPAEIQEALGELVGAAREGLLALSVGVGLRVVHELMEAEVTEIVEPRGKHDSCLRLPRNPGLSAAAPTCPSRYGSESDPTWPPALESPQGR